MATINPVSNVLLQFGTVYLAVEKKTGMRYAVKSISKRKAESDPNFRKDIRSEVGFGQLDEQGAEAIVSSCVYSKKRFVLSICLQSVCLLEGIQIPNLQLA